MEKFHSDPRLSRIPVIVLTGADLDSGQLKLLSEYGNQILTKGSLNENDLLRQLQETLNKIRPTVLVN
jgi:CheY-like chemotaxis protein